MSAPSTAPTLADLELALERAESRLARAPYINNTARMIAEETRCHAEIAGIKARIAAMIGPKAAAADVDPHGDFERAYDEAAGIRS
jgi:hypothetical protein